MSLSLLNFAISRIVSVWSSCSSVVQTARSGNPSNCALVKSFCLAPAMRTTDGAPWIMCCGDGVVEGGGVDGYNSVEWQCIEEKDLAR